MKINEQHTPYNLLAAHLANELSFSQKEALKSWIDENPKNQTILSELKTIWDYKDFNVEKALKSFRK